ncbi:uncharacterized protein RCH25_025016 [Pelodytes ibericus]
MKMETTHLPTVHETVLPDPDCTLFVDGSRFADEQGRYHTGFAVTTVDQVLQASPLPPSMSAQEAELKALTVACQMFEGKRVNIYTDSRYALGVAHDFGLIWKTRGFLTATGTPVKHGTAIKELMYALLLPEEVAILKVKAHGRRDSEETCGNHKADQAAKDAACESREVDRRVSGEEIPIFPMQTLPKDLKFLKEQQAAVSPEEKESWKQKGATLQDGVYTSNLKFCLPKSIYPPVVQWAHRAAQLSKTLMNSLITKYFEAPVYNDIPNNKDPYICVTDDYWGYECSSWKAAGLLSNLFLRPKKCRGVQPVINLHPLNTFISYQHFKMEGIHCLRDLLLIADGMVKLDFQDAYLTVPVETEHQHYPQFIWETQIWHFTCLPFSLSSAPWCFTKHLKSVDGRKERGPIDHLPG